MQDDSSKTPVTPPVSAVEPALIPDLTEEQPAKGHEVTEGTTIETPAAIQDLKTDTGADASASEKIEKTASIVGRITTLMSADIDQIMESRDLFLFVVYGPLQIILGTIFLYQILSWSALVGMASGFLTLPLPGLLAKLLNTAQKDLMQLTDKRVQAVTEALTTLRLVKMFAWESNVKERLSKCREAEIRAIKRTKILYALITTVVFLAPVLPMGLAYGLYVGVEHKVLTAAKVFASISVFDMLRMQQYILVDQVYKVITVRVSLQRFDDFLRNTRLLDRVGLGGSRVDGTPAKAEETDDTDISIRDCDFVWSKAEGSDECSTDKSFRLTVGSLKFPLGQTTIISGSTGSGKSSLLM
jgi:ABC-type multidrug transport system fused ATPase/permease subunit